MAQPRAPLYIFKIAADDIIKLRRLDVFRRVLGFPLMILKKKAQQTIELALYFPTTCGRLKLGIPNSQMDFTRKWLLQYLRKNGIK